MRDHVGAACRARIHSFVLCLSVQNLNASSHRPTNPIRSYDLRGKMPAYVPPKPSDFLPTVDSRLAPDIAERLKSAAQGLEGQRPNYIMHNVKAAKNPTQSYRM